MSRIQHHAQNSRTDSCNVIVLLSESLMSRTTIRSWILVAIDDISKNFCVLFVFHYRSKIFYKVSLVTCDKIYIYIYFFFENLSLHRYDIFFFFFKTKKKIIFHRKRYQILIRTSFNFSISCTIPIYILHLLIEMIND